ncbi:MAG TPA: NAD(P)/FAD-dependent oxidoreductase [Pyrinomonadaceae bacterium]|nr:NAD(P)/FAD-dependent oxidoreductase [Pyrinomonadaceae bacterium]
MHEWDVIVIGAGAAGLFCAIEAGKRGRRVLVIEHADRVGKKIAISGGGRCNFTNTGTSPDNFVSRNPHFCKSALARYTPADFIALVEKHGIAYHEKKLGQLFCDGSSQQIIDMLLRECRDAAVEIRCGCAVLQVAQNINSHEPVAGRSFMLQTNQGTFHSSSLVIATGGLSIAPLGATDFGYRIARQFGLRIEDTRAGLVPLTLPAQILKALAALSGVSIDALVTCPQSPSSPSFRENILITHRGLSGPAILQVSNYWQPGESISINLLPDEDVMEIISAARISEGDSAPGSAQGVTQGATGGASSRIELVNLLSRYLPRRFAHAWCDLYGASRPLKTYNGKELQEIAANIHRLQLTPAGTEGFNKAEVTVGGVSTAELSSQTMEARRVPGLYFIGEVVDVTGQLGGYNFQWAWASAFAAGQVV